MTRSYAALVPLRGGSKSIPGKNIKPFQGRPLCAWVLEAALGASAINSVWVSTDSEAIAAAVREISPRIKIHPRPDHLGGDLVTTEAVILDWLATTGLHNGHVVTLQATSPQTKASDLDRAVSQLEEEGADSLVTGTRTHRFLWDDAGRPLNYDPANRPMRQQWSGTFMENGAFYVSRCDLLLAGEPRLHGRISLYIMDSLAGIELDEPDDWTRLEAKFKERTGA